MDMSSTGRGSAAKTAFAGRLREAMKDAGYVAKRGARSGVDARPLAIELGLKTQEMARRYLDGTAWPRPEKMEHIAKWLGVNTWWLRDGHDPKRGPIGGLSPEEKEILEAYRSGPKEIRDAIDTIARLGKK